jgi:hypothetical protein
MITFVYYRCHISVLSGRNVKVTTHFHKVSRSNRCRTLPSRPYTPSCCGIHMQNSFNVSSVKENLAQYNMFCDFHLTLSPFLLL